MDTHTHTQKHVYIQSTLSDKKCTLFMCADVYVLGQFCSVLVPKKGEVEGDEQISIYNSIIYIYVYICTFSLLGNDSYSEPQIEIQK